MVGSGINAGNITSGIIGFGRTHTYGDLGNEGRLDNNHDDDLMTKSQVESKISALTVSSSDTYTPLPKNQSGDTVSVQEFYTKTAGLNLDGTHTHTINLGINPSVYDVVSVEITIYTNGGTSGFPVNFVNDFGGSQYVINPYYHNGTLHTALGRATQNTIYYQSQLNARYYVYPSGSSTYLRLYIRPGGYFDSSSFNSAKIGIVSNTNEQPRRKQRGIRRVPSDSLSVIWNNPHPDS